MTPAGPPPDLDTTLERARALGFLGPGPVAIHRAHAEGFGSVVETTFDRAPLTLVDLGSGGGVPGLILAARWPGCAIVLVESNHRRAEHLQGAVEEWGWGERVAVVEDRAELVAHRPEYRERFEVVTARSLAGPAATAEIAAGLVAVGGILVVSDPPEPAPRRWPSEQLADLGFGPADRREAVQVHFVVLPKERAAPSQVPRGVGRPAKRPRW